MDYYKDTKKPNLERDYSESWDERPNGMRILKMKAKLIPDARDSNGDFLFGYKAEAALNYNADKAAMKVMRQRDVFENDYEVEFSFSLLDEDGFSLYWLTSWEKDLEKSHTSVFWNLLPGGKTQTQQTIITGKKIPSSLAKRIKKVKVAHCIRKFQSHDDENQKTSQE